MEVFIGTIQPFGFNFAPRGWATCQGQLMGIAQNSALFSLLGTTYGGDGQTTFGLPDLQGRMPIGQGNGNGLTPRTIGEISGTENTTLTLNNMPAHSHPVTSTVTVQVAGTPTGADNTPSATNSFLGGSQAGGATAANIWSTALNGPVTMGGTSSSVTVSLAGGSQPFGLMNPFLALNFCIALEGIFPSRN
jgi:microcystin-dependent protein